MDLAANEIPMVERVAGGEGGTEREFKLSPEDCQVVAQALQDYLWKHEGIGGGAELEKLRETIRRLHEEFNLASGVTLEEAGGEAAPGIEGEEIP